MCKQIVGSFFEKERIESGGLLKKILGFLVCKMSGGEDLFEVFGVIFARKGVRSGARRQDLPKQNGDVVVGTCLDGVFD